nr:MAG TPA: hypothetical protein [Caudoviricetes sp.]DAW32933.1 MAG TPA: hypothetical protein [Caudoviricetes sp.]
MGHSVFGVPFLPSENEGGFLLLTIKAQNYIHG